MRRSRWMTSVVVMLVVASGVLSPLGAGQASAQTATPRTGSGDGGRYESPNFGYTLTYDAVVWTVSADDQEPDDGYDQIGLTNGTSFITLIGTTDWTGDQLAECVESYAAFRAETEGISDFAPLTGADDDDDTSGLYTYTYNDNEFTEYLECRDLESAVVIILHDVASADYDDEVEARDDLLDGLEPGDAPADPTSTPRSGSRTPVSMGTPRREETPTPAESEPGVYTSPTYDYVIPYGDEDWKVTNEDSDDDIDTLEITNDVSVVTFTGAATSDDAAACLSEAVDALLNESEYRDFNQAVTGSDDPYEGDGVLGPYTGYTDGETAVYLECGLSPDGDVALVVRVVSSLDDFGNEIGPVSDILADITWDSGSERGRATSTPRGGNETPTEEPSTPESDNSYVDDDNGWSLTWDESWTLNSDPETDDMLILDNGVSLVSVNVIADTDDAEDCLRDQVALMTDDEKVSNVNRFKVDDETVRGGDETAAFAAYSYEYELDSGPSDLVSYFDCRLLPSGDEVVLVTQIVTADAYEDEAEAVADLLDGLTIGEQSGTEDSTPTEEPDATSTRVASTDDENEYTNQTYDYSISWDDTWTREDTDDEDILELTNGVSIVNLFTYDGGDALDCVDDNFRLQKRTYDDLEQALGTDDEPLAGGDETGAFSVYVGTDSDGESIIISFFCLPISTDTSVVFQHQTTADAYNDEIEARTALFDALVLPDN